MTTIESIQRLIQTKSAPLQLRVKHTQTLDAEIAELEAKTAEYLAEPTAKLFKEAHEAEIKLVAARSLRSRLEDFDLNQALTYVLDLSYEAAPLFEQLATENETSLAQCRENLKRFRIEAASLSEPDPTTDLQIRIYTHKIHEAEKQNKSVRAWIKTWVEGGYSPQYENFHAISGTLINIQIDAPVYANVDDVPLPENYQKPHQIVGVRAPIIGNVLTLGH